MCRLCQRGSGRFLSARVSRNLPGFNLQLYEQVVLRCRKFQQRLGLTDSHISRNEKDRPEEHGEEEETDQRLEMGQPNNTLRQDKKRRLRELETGGSDELPQLDSDELPRLESDNTIK